MGTFYTIGIIKEFKVTSNEVLLMDTWHEKLADRLDLELFELKVEENKLFGKLKKDIFDENIEDFYSTLRKILGKKRNANIDYYEKSYGKDLDEYPTEKNYVYLDELKLETTFAFLFIEGKVLVEEFNSDPLLINYLFRNSTIENPLKGCVISEIIG